MDSWIVTNSGIKFMLNRPTANMVCIEDIAYSLSMLCRFNGHCKQFYSVAQHSVYVSLHLPEKLALWGLLHDAHEAYVGDMANPLYRYTVGEGDSAYTKCAQNVIRAIVERFSLKPKLAPSEVMKVDSSMLKTEAEALMRGGLEGWGLRSVEAINLGYEGLPLMKPELAKDRLLARFKQLMPEYYEIGV